MNPRRELSATVSVPSQNEPDELPCRGSGLGRSAGFVWLCCWLSIAAWFINASFAQTREPVAVVSGQAIYEEDLLPLIEGQMRQIRRQEYEAKSQALDSLLNQKLLEAEAAKRGIAPLALLQQEADAKVTPTTDAEVEAVYAAQKDRINRPLAEVKGQIQQMLRQSKVEQARETFLRNLRAAADVTINLRAPKVEVTYDSGRVRGDPNAPITIVEFSDFQCPFCQRAHPVVKELLSRYPTQVKLAYRDFPLRQIHPQADAAAEAARCAGEQGKFWQFHDRLFESNRALDLAAFADHAAAIGMDQGRFVDCLAADKFQSQIEQDLQDGTRVGVNGTPGFFINGVMVTGAQPLAVFERVVQEELDALRRARPAQVRAGPN
jgi:protein-disulfide isomerase